MNEQPRKPAGAPTGGQFSPHVRNEPDNELIDNTSFDDTADDWTAHIDDLEAAITCSSEELWGYVRHPSSDVRAEASMNPRITTEQLQELASDDDWIVRWSVAQLPYRAGVAELVANDRDPVVRATVLENGFDLPPVVRARLEIDEEVSAICQLLRTGGQPN